MLPLCIQFIDYIVSSCSSKHSNSLQLDSRNISQLQGEAARSIAVGATQLARWTGSARSAFEILEGRVAAFETKNEAHRKELARLTSRCMAEKSSESACLATIERKMIELGTSLAKTMKERLQTSIGRRKRRSPSDETTRRVGSRVSNTHVTKGRQAEWQTVEKRRKRRGRRRNSR
jgi:hypothetical protein